MDIAGQLEDAGAMVVGPAADLATTLDLIAQFRFDANFLDANLDDHPADGIADALTQCTRDL